MALDRLRFHNILVRESVASTEAATELAKVIDSGIADELDGLASRQDLDVLRLEIISELQARLNSHFRWMITMWASAIAAIVALAVAIIARGG